VGAKIKTTIKTLTHKTMGIRKVCRSLYLDDDAISDYRNSLKNAQNFLHQNQKRQRVFEKDIDNLNLKNCTSPKALFSLTRMAIKKRGRLVYRGFTGSEAISQAKKDVLFFKTAIRNNKKALRS